MYIFGKIKTKKKKKNQVVYATNKPAAIISFDVFFGGFFFANISVFAIHLGDNNVL